jgi:hypothetical protein
MPRLNTDYTRTVIYMIKHIENEELIYIGSTTDFTKRKYSHKRDCMKQKVLKVYEMINKNGGWDSFKMIQIKEFPYANKREAEAEEE